jgi:hypothetical protein
MCGTRGMRWNNDNRLPNSRKRPNNNSGFSYRRRTSRCSTGMIAGVTGSAATTAGTATADRPVAPTVPIVASV